MAFFKANRTLVDDELLEAENSSNKLRYVIDKNGKGKWLRPVPSYRLPYDFEEDVYY